MNQYTVFYPAILLVGVLVGMAIQKYKHLPVLPERKRRPSKKKLEAVLEETHLNSWLGVMRDDRADSLDLVRYRYKWKENAMLALTNVKRLALTARPHSSTEMARIHKFMATRARPIEKRELAARRRQ